MMVRSSILATIVLLVTSTSAAPADDGQWRPEQYGGAAVVSTAAAAASPTVQTKPLDTTGPTPSLIIDATKKPKGVVTATATQAATLTAASWESEVTWPAGCEEWANPCPSGAKISGGGIAGYTNGFTSYLTQTDSRGVITGHPEVATIAAGVTEAKTTLITSTRASNGTFSSRSPSSTRTGFTVGTETPVQSNGAGMTAIFSTSSLIIAAAALALVC